MSEQRVISLYIEANPNPNSLKFVADKMLFPEGASFDFPDKESAKHAPLASELFNFPFVRRVFYMSNFITVTKIEEVEWEDIKLQLRDYIKSHIEQGKALLTREAVEEEEKNVPGQAAGATAASGAGSDMDERIISILDEYIKPAVEMDGGAIQYHSYNDGVVKVLLQGSCSGCPSSTLTLKSGIENLLKSMIPEVKSVEAEGV